MFINYVDSHDIFGQINVNRLIYRTSTLCTRVQVCGVWRGVYITYGG